ncbi:uncharacterized protein TRIADDRAFT_61031 [Trichoplax adhaerens]|uniref:PA domain-containing protein n=1 Tax=Trichoplax adhaerens TaxID=10228 RepID=B3S9U5_TRIAD|nr:hypothetical protein TRIADDRAFT_61031 [Trichoplax adhaerens]EDV20533.1 hypothetical protein TRIADDRAFT_61031 [Trichoplax adhaerens]|eukprot:XP_002116959.1 hypothetical protein TRIADDRAFT_61031 [Trichoplax adhaerens]
MNYRLSVVALVLVITCSLLQSVDCYRRADFTYAQINVTWTYKNITFSRYYRDKFYYGKNSAVNPAEGMLITAVVSEGCHSDNYGPIRNNERWIAFVRRGSCYFNQKIDAAKKLNASGIIIYDNMDGDELIMTDKHVRNFISVSTTKSTGNDLLHIMRNGTQVYVRITTGSTVDHWDFNRTSIFFVSVSFIIFMVVSLGWLLVYYFQRFRYLKNRQRNQIEIHELITFHQCRKGFKLTYVNIFGFGNVIIGLGVIRQSPTHTLGNSESSFC